MLQRYKLRLGDGTVLLVDLDGLSTWLVDRKAQVQAERSHKWLPLKEFLAQERAAARREARLRAALVPPPPKDDGPPSPPPPPEHDTPPPTPPPEPREDGLPLVPPPPPREDVPSVPAPAEVWAPATERPLSDQAESPSGLGAPPECEPIAKIGVGEPRLVEHDAPGRSATPVPADTIEPALIDEPAAVQVLAEEPAGPDPAGREASPIGDLPVVPFKNLDDEAPALSADRPETEHSHVTVQSGVQARADEPAAIGPDAGQPIPINELPVVPLKPLDDEVPQSPDVPPPEVGPDSAIAPRRVAILADDPVVSPAERRGAPSSASGEALWVDGHAASALRVVGRFGTFLSRCLDPINRLERGLPPFGLEERRAWLKQRPTHRAPQPPATSARVPPEIRPLAEEPTPAAEEPQRLSMDDGLPIIPFKPVDGGDAASGSPTRIQESFVRATVWIAGLMERVARLSRRERRQLSISSEEPSAPPAPAPHPAVPPPREALQAPPAISELPTLRLAATDEPREMEEVYDGDENESFLPVVWLWAKRLAWATALLAVGVFAAANRDAWLPQATELGEQTLTEIDERVRTGHFAKRQQQAVDEAAGKLPHLAPRTIWLIMSSSPIRVLDAPDVFEIACEATDRGLPALTASDAEELKALRQELLDTLRPADRDRVREFDRARARGAVFPLDVRLGLRLYALGARELPAVSRERLRVLLGRAITAGLAQPTEVEWPAPTRPPRP